MTEDKKYVWEVWTDSALPRPHVTRWVLVKMNGAGGCTVSQRGLKVVRPASRGKKFFTEEVAMRDYVRGYLQASLHRARSLVKRLEAELSTADCGVEVVVVPDTPPAPRKIKPKDGE